MGLFCLCFVALGCSARVPRYVIDIGRLADTSPETSDKRLREMVPVRLIGEQTWEDQNRDVKEWLVGLVRVRKYKLMENAPDKFESHLMIDIGFDHVELADWFEVFFVESVPRVAPEEALRRLGFDSQDLLKHPHLPDTWLACIEDRRIYLVQSYVCGEVCLAVRVRKSGLWQTADNRYLRQDDNP